MTKFRIPVYSYSTKEFLYFAYMTISHGTVVMNPSVYSNDVVFGDEEISLNLFDVNQKEIYKGDIVKINAGCSGDHFYDECIAEIGWLNDESCYYLFDPKDKYGIVHQDYYSFCEFEVIGNKHQNSELLKRKYV